MSHQLDFEIAGHRNVDRNLRTFEKNTRLKSHHIFLKFTSGVFLDSLFDVSTLKIEKSDMKQSVPIQNPVKHPIYT